MSETFKSGSDCADILALATVSPMTRIRVERNRQCAIFSLRITPRPAIYFQQLLALCAGAAGAVAGAPPAGSPITGSSSGLAPRPRPPRPGGVHPSHAGPFCTMRVSALTV